MIYLFNYEKFWKSIGVNLKIFRLRHDVVFARGLNEIHNLGSYVKIVWEMFINLSSNHTRGHLKFYILHVTSWAVFLGMLNFWYSVIFYMSSTAKQQSRNFKMLVNNHKRAKRRWDSWESRIVYVGHNDAEHVVWSESVFLVHVLQCASEPEIFSRRIFTSKYI